MHKNIIFYFSLSVILFSGCAKPITIEQPNKDTAKIYFASPDRDIFFDEEVIVYDVTKNRKFIGVLDGKDYFIKEYKAGKIKIEYKLANYKSIETKIAHMIKPLSIEADIKKDKTYCITFENRLFKQNLLSYKLRIEDDPKICSELLAGYTKNTWRPDFEAHKKFITKCLDKQSKKVALGIFNASKNKEKIDAHEICEKMYLKHSHDITKQ